MATLWNLVLVVSLLVLSAPQRCSGVNHGSVVGLSQELAQLKNQQENHDKKVRHLEKSVAECQQLVSNHTNTEELLSNKVTTLKENADRVRECKREQEIIQLVEQFSLTNDWGDLRKGLEAVLDRSGEPYRQLQRIDYSSNEPLWYVGSYGSTQLASLLLEAGLPVDTADADADTMLHGAAVEGHLQLVKLLLDHGASVNVKDYDARTPLMYASYAGNLELVKLLVSAGADITARTISKFTALDYARIFGHTEIFVYLLLLQH